MGTLLHCWWKSKLIKSLWKSVCGFLKKKKKKLGRELSYDPTIPLLGIYPEETIPERDAGAPIFFAVLKEMQMPQYSLQPFLQ